MVQERLKTPLSVQNRHFGSWTSCRTENHLGSTAAVINDKGELIEATMYTAYGEQVPLMVLPGTEAAAREKFTGKEFDTEGGSGNGVDGINLDYFGARFLDPEVGIWTSEDPMLQSWNTYGYCGGNPINNIDPNGQVFTDIEDPALQTSYEGFMGSYFDREGHFKSHMLSEIDVSYWNEFVHKSGEEDGYSFKDFYKTWSERPINPPAPEPVVQKEFISNQYNFFMNAAEIQLEKQRIDARLAIDVVLYPMNQSTVTTTTTGNNGSSLIEQMWNDISNSDPTILMFAFPALGMVEGVGAKTLPFADDALGIAGKITGYTKHGINQAISRDGGLGVSARAILDAVKNPQNVISQAKGAAKYVGNEATVILNKAGEVISTWGKPRVP